MARRPGAGPLTGTGAPGPPDRDRRGDGRAQNARPRDGLGRPLPHDATGVERVPDGLALPPDESLTEAQRLLDAGRPFHAHEVLEGTWKAAPPAERALWQGLAQIAVGLTHLGRGNATGARSLLARGAARITAYAEDPPHGIDVTGLIAFSAQVRADIDAGNDGGNDAAVPRLRVPGSE